MRTFLVILSLFISINSWSQVITIDEAKAYTDELVKRSFLTKKGKDAFLKALDKGDIEVEHRSTVKGVSYTEEGLYKETILQFCYSAITTELMSRLNDDGMKIDQAIADKEPLDDSLGRTYSMMDGLAGNRDFQESISPQISVFGYTRRKTLEIFFKTGLIDQKIYDETKVALDKKLLRDEVVLLQFLLERSSFYTFYDFNRREQEEYISSLTRKGIFTTSERDSLLNFYKPQELKSIPEMLKFSHRFVAVDLHSYPPDPKKTYPVIFNEVKKLLPEFNYSDLKVELVEEKESDLIRQDVKLSFTIDGNVYSHLFFHDYKKEKPELNEPVSEPSRVDQDFHKGINKWLTDIGSVYRLYSVNMPEKDESYYGGRRVGLLLLKEGEAGVITSEVYLMSEETFDARLSQKNIQELLEEFSRHGFFKHLTNAEIAAGKEKIAINELRTIEDVLAQFPKSIVAFDWESGNLENPYEELTKEFMEASRGAFKVTGIKDEFKKGLDGAKTVEYSFTLNGKRYKKMLEFTSDWLDPAFMDLLKSALKENKIDGWFYKCIDDGQASGYIFLTAEQQKFIKERYPDLLKPD